MSNFELLFICACSDSQNHKFPAKAAISRSVRKVKRAGSECRNKSTEMDFLPEGQNWYEGMVPDSQSGAL